MEEPAAPDIRIFEIEDDLIKNNVYKDDIIYEDETEDDKKMDNLKVHNDLNESREGSPPPKSAPPSESDKTIAGAMSGFLMAPRSIMASTMSVHSEVIDLSCKGSDD